MARVKVGTYLSGEPICAIKRGGLVHNNDHNYVTYVTKQDKSPMISTHDTSLKLNFKFSLMLGPHQSPIYFYMN